MASSVTAALRASRTADGGFVIEGVEGGALRARPHAGGGYALEAGGRPFGTLEADSEGPGGWILRGGPSGDEECGRTTREAADGSGLPATVLLADGTCFRLEVAWGTPPEVRLLGLEGPGPYLRARLDEGRWRGDWTPAGLDLRRDRVLAALVGGELVRLGPADAREGADEE